MPTVTPIRWLAVCSFAIAVLAASLASPRSCLAERLQQSDAPSSSEAVEEHPLVPVLRIAEEGYERIGREVKDYTCRIIRRERLRGKLKPYEFISAKIRHQQPVDAAEGEVTTTSAQSTSPFSVYLHFDKPSSVVGREILYREGRDAGQMLVRRGGRRMAYVTTYMAPDSKVALDESRYPVTSIGFQRLIGRLIEVAKQDMQYDECNVQFFDNAKIGDRPCTRILVEHPVKRDYFRFHRAIVFIDKERQIPLGYASYTWPTVPGGKPVLVEEYIYANVKLNVGLTDADFDRTNPSYGFLRRDQIVAADGTDR